MNEKGHHSTWIFDSVLLSDKSEQMKKAIKFRNSIFGSIFLKFTIVYTVIMILLFYTIGLSSRYAFINQAKASSLRELSAISSSVQSALSHISDYVVSVSLNSDVIATCNENPVPPTLANEDYEVRRKLNSTVNSIIGTNSSIRNWDILSLSGDFFKTSGFDMKNVKGISPESIRKGQGSDLGVEISGPFVLNTNAVTSVESTEYCFLVTKPVVYLNTNKVVGYIVFVIDETLFDNMINQYIPQNMLSHYYILNGSGFFIMSDRKGIIDSKYDGVDDKALSSATGALLSVETVSAVLRDSSIFARCSMIKPEWNIIISYPLETMINEQRFFNKIFAIVTIAAYALFLLLSFIISLKISKPVHDLVEEMDSITENAYSTIVVPDTVEEIQILYQGYNHMMETTNALLNSIDRTYEEKEKYHFQLLQSQIHPHFLYNTLEMIKSMIDLGMNQEASGAIVSLSSFYRSSLSQGADVITLGKEMKISESYLLLEQMRHQGCFTYEISSYDSYRDFLMPKLTLQPIIENSVKHGVNTVGVKGRIVIEMQADADILKINVTDNGHGIMPDDLRKLNMNLHGSTADGSSMSASSQTSFGLYNVDRRIKSYFGNQYGLVIESIYGEYTKVSVTIPAVTFLGERI